MKFKKLNTKNEDNKSVDVKIRGLYKKYKIVTEKNTTLFEKIINFVSMTQKENDFYALTNINMDIYKGESIGIIGDNGSGKSTLLKLISKTLVPTKGDITIKRKLVPVLDLGITFQHELTGRENIYLYGAVLGLNRKEINKKFNKIVKFAELEKFIDTKIKKFSSGMKVRLAFAICMQTYPKIIVLDEIFAVGDKNFQTKCYKIFDDFHKKGNTIILSSHDMNVISKFCNRTLYLKNGTQVMFDKTDKVVRQYLKDQKSKTRNLSET